MHLQGYVIVNLQIILSHAKLVRWQLLNAILSNYDTCTEQMKLFVNSIALSVNEITQTDGQNCGIFRHVDRTEINKKYANEKNC